MIIKLKVLTVILLIIFGNSLQAQSSSSYSRIGLGDIEYSYTARTLGMGQSGVALSNSDFVGMTNPAGLNGLSRVRLETGVNYTGIFQDNNGKGSYHGAGEFSGFTFAFPVSPAYGVGAAFGILPYSNVSYEVSQDVSSDVLSGEDYRILYEGSGGLSKMFIASSYRLPFGLIIGASFDYYFGNLNYISKTEFFNSKNRNAEYERSYSPRGIGTTLGIITPDFSSLFNSSSVSDFRLGASVNLISELTTDTILTSTSSAGTDTIQDGSTTIKIPMRITAGLAFSIDKNYLFSIDYIMQPWSEYEFNGIPSASLRDAMKLSAGFEYRKTRQPGATFWELVIWRAGLSYEETQYMINGSGINQYSVSGGFSLPVSNENTIDIGLQYANRASSDAGLYSENIVRVSFGISLGEIWFLRSEK